jgi:hypothetical protein
VIDDYYFSKSVDKEWQKEQSNSKTLREEATDLRTVSFAQNIF